MKQPRKRAYPEFVTGESRDETVARVAAAWLAATQALGHALTSREMTAHWATYGEGQRPPRLSDVLPAVLHRGLLLKASSPTRLGHCRYVHRDAPLVSGKGPTDAIAPDDILAALGQAVQRHGRCVSCMEVVEELKALGYDPRAKWVQERTYSVLWNFTRPRVQRGGGDTSERRTQPGLVTILRTDADYWGETGPIKVWWRLTAEPAPRPPAELELSDKTAAARILNATRRAIGRPPTLLEASLNALRHRLANPSDPVVGRFDETRLRYAVQMARWRAWSGRRRPSEAFDAIRTPYHEGRSRPAHYALPPVSDVEYRHVVAVGALAAVRPSREVRLLDAMAEQPGTEGPAFQRLLTLRRALLRQLLLEHVPAAEWLVVAPRIHAECDLLTEWVRTVREHSALTRLQRRARHLIAERTEDLQACTAFLGLAEPIDADAVQTLVQTAARVGGAGLLPASDATELVAMIARMRRTEEPIAQKVLLRVRRFATPGIRRIERKADLGKLRPAFALDRVEAFLSAADNLALPTACAILGGVHTVLGTTLRDTGVLRTLFAQMPRNVTWARQAAIAGLGVLGEVPEPATWCGDPALHEAGVLGTVLAAPGTAAGRLRALLREHPGGALRRVVHHALMQVDAGEWLAAVD